MPTLVFGFSTSTSTFIYLDSVSVVNNNASSIQLLNNPGFDNSTLNLTGWTTWCAPSCSIGFSGRVLANTSCHSGNCYIDHCRTPDYDYLVQSFPATIGNIYTISFWLELVGVGTFRFYASVQNWIVQSESQQQDRKIPKHFDYYKDHFILFFFVWFYTIHFFKTFFNINFEHRRNIHQFVLRSKTCQYWHSRNVYL
jgi:hypothetical protein